MQENGKNQQVIKSRPDWILVLEFIHLIRANKYKNFSIGDISSETNIDRFKITRVLFTLKRMKFVIRTQRAHRYRYWRFTKDYPKDFFNLLDMFETFKVLEGIEKEKENEINVSTTRRRNKYESKG